MPPGGSRRDAETLRTKKEVRRNRPTYAEIGWLKAIRRKLGELILVARGG